MTSTGIAAIGGLVYFEDLRVGVELPSAVRQPSSRDLVLFAAGSGDYNEIHYDAAAAQAAGLPAVIVHGRLKAVYLTQLVAAWMGTGSRFRSFRVRFGGIDVVGNPMTLGGTVASLTAGTGGAPGEVEIDLWIKDGTGKTTTTGAAVVQVPTTREGAR